MRDYLSLARQRATEVIPHPTVIRTLILRHRAYAFAIAAVFLVAVMAGLFVLRNMAAGMQTQKNDSMSNTAQTAAQDPATTVGDDSTQSVANRGDTMNTDQTNADGSQSSSQSSAKVTVNNQQITVPENGSVTKTVHSSDGSTSINITSNNSSNSNSQSNSSTSTSLNVNTNTNSDNSTTVNVDRSTSH